MEKNNSDDSDDLNSSLPSKIRKIFLRCLKNKYYLALAFALVLLGVFLVFYFINNNSDDKLTKNTSKTSHKATQSTVLISSYDTGAEISVDGNNWKPLNDGRHLFESQYLKTSAKGRVVLTFENNSVIRLDGSTTIYASSLQKNKVAISIRSGNAYAHIIQSKTNFSLRSDRDIFAASGAAFLVSNTKTTKGVSVFEGSISKDKDIINEGKQYFSKHPNTNLVGKISSIDTNTLTRNSFVMWNLERDRSNDNFSSSLGILKNLTPPSQSNIPLPSNGADEAMKRSIKLKATKSGSGVILTWELINAKAPDGLLLMFHNDKILYYSENEAEIAYEEDAYIHIGSPSDGEYRNSFRFDYPDGNTWTFKACVIVDYDYPGGVCSWQMGEPDAVWSNTLNITMPLEPAKLVEDGQITLTNEGNVLKWQFTGTAPNGFEIQYSDDDYGYEHIKVLPGKTTYDLSKLFETPRYKSGDKEKFKVCKFKYPYHHYNYEGCVDHSNPIEITIP